MRAVDRPDVLATIRSWQPQVIVPLMCRIGKEEVDASAALRVIHQNVRSVPARGERGTTRQEEGEGERVGR